jgi:3D (Asp-Asp-Asp) domain-containing protein
MVLLLTSILIYANIGIRSRKGLFNYMFMKLKVVVYTINLIFMSKSLILKTLVGTAIAGTILGGVIMPQGINADLNNVKVTLSPATLISNGHLTITKLNKTSFEVIKKVKMVVTAYSSTPDQTDDTPFITASGKHVKDGIIANNMLPFGTKVRIPELGNKIFTVEDRMNKRMGLYRADIWVPTTKEALRLGVKNVTLEVIES